jgi:hypothetical protein
LKCKLVNRSQALNSVETNIQGPDVNVIALTIYDTSPEEVISQIVDLWV